MGELVDIIFRNIVFPKRILNFNLLWYKGNKMCDIFYSKNRVYLRTTIVKPIDYCSGRSHHTYCSALLPQKEQTVCTLANIVTPVSFN